MNLAFNLLLAVGGGVAVPAGVGAVAVYLVRRQEPAIYAEIKRDLFPEVSDDHIIQPVHIDEPVSA